MTPETQRFFIALLPPPQVQTVARQVQQTFADQYHSRAALRSPPHITLQPPFIWATAEQTALHQALTDFAHQTPPIPITLSGFGAFPPRVIYIRVEKTPELLSIQKRLMAYLEISLGIVDRVGKSRPFAPHITVGFRDLTPPHFKAAWAEFQSRSLTFQFTVPQLTLLIHDGKRWNIATELAFVPPLHQEDCHPPQG